MTAIDVTTLSDDCLSVKVDDRHHGQKLAQWVKSRFDTEEIVPGVDSVGIRFDPLLIDVSMLLASIDELDISSLPDISDKPIIHDIPITYGGVSGPDLARIAQVAKLSIDDVIARHSRPLYTVDAVGFMPGFAYMSGLDPALTLPRRPMPRPRLQAGSVAVAGKYCGIYPLASPGGWHVLGCTQHPLFLPDKDQPFVLRPGDRVRFSPS